MSIDKAAVSMARSAELMALTMLLREHHKCGSHQAAMECGRLAVAEVRASFCYPNFACDEHVAHMYTVLERQADGWNRSSPGRPGHRVDPPREMIEAKMVRRFYVLLTGEPI
jgi:hypothetical protein